MTDDWTIHPSNDKTDDDDFPQRRVTNILRPTLPKKNQQPPFYGWRNLIYFEHKVTTRWLDHILFLRTYIHTTANRSYDPHKYSFRLFQKKSSLVDLMWLFNDRFIFICLHGSYSTSSGWLSTFHDWWTRPLPLTSASDLTHQQSIPTHITVGGRTPKYTNTTYKRWMIRIE